jgi:PAN domain
MSQIESSTEISTLIFPRDFFSLIISFPTTKKQACKYNRAIQSPRFGVSEDKVAQYVGLHYYTDKELQVTSEAACKLACEIENEFLCRSFLYLGQPTGQQYNCRLYHLDHKSLPDGPSTYLNVERPLIDVGEPTGVYMENFCESKRRLF